MLVIFPLCELQVSPDQQLAEAKCLLNSVSSLADQYKAYCDVYKNLRPCLATAGFPETQIVQTINETRAKRFPTGETMGEKCGCANILLSIGIGFVCLAAIGIQKSGLLPLH
ncbi:hypothetical protein DdX_17779 [Ditylenchus destructor]|uniref:Uncharacterized protein n=1 Tax=Ditylenchus destructor TaxID=166010 RepID=A0AAD4MLH3_9BILA|nr:hypothetical protein DdX_17779 [Ditylenchus destructor]